MIAVAAAAMAAVALTIFVELSDPEEVVVGASTYSRSAIGHEVLLELLRKRGVDASASRGASVEKLSQGGVLVLAEPDFSAGGKQVMQHLLTAPVVLLVLPKWAGSADGNRRGWLNVVAPKPLYLIQAVLEDADIATSLNRVDHAAVFPNNRLGAPAHLEDPPQLLHGDGMQALVSGPDGVLLGRVASRGREIFVLSDPDVISNHGMAHGNAALALAVIERARHGGRVVFDETIHGFNTVPSGKFRLLTARPFFAATLNVLLAAGCLIWAGARRFGAARTRPSTLRPGQLALIAQITDLLLGAGQQGELLRRYVLATLADVAARLNGPDMGDAASRDAWITRMQAQRGMTRDGVRIAAAAGLAAAGTLDAAGQFALAEDAYLWKQEMLNGQPGAGQRGGGYSRRNPQGRGGPG